MACMVAAGALAGGLTVAMTGSARAEVIPPTDTWAEIYTPYTNAHPVCLDDPNGTSAVGTPLQVFHCHGYGSDGAPQRWDFNPLAFYGQSVYNIFKAGRCISVDSPTSPLGGARVRLETCGILGEPWHLISLGADSVAYPDFELEFSHSGYCMTLPDWSGRNGEPVVLEPCDPGNLLQHWILG
jgi:hypothetical protein